MDKKEIGKTTAFIKASKYPKYHGVTLTKQVNDLYDQSFKKLKKKTEEGIRR